MLDVAGTKNGREEHDEKTGISEKLILEWFNLSDLIRIKGVVEESSDRRARIRSYRRLC